MTGDDQEEEEDSPGKPAGAAASAAAETAGDDDGLSGHPRQGSCTFPPAAALRPPLSVPAAREEERRSHLGAQAPRRWPKREATEEVTSTSAPLLMPTSVGRPFTGWSFVMRIPAR
jgi:hypothetical protein